MTSKIQNQESTENFIEIWREQLMRCEIFPMQRLQQDNKEFRNM